MVLNRVQNIVRFSFLPISSLFGERFDNTGESITPTEKQADKSVLKEETGWDRLKAIFIVDEFGYISNEIHSVLQVATMSSFIGALYGGVLQSRSAYLEFMRNNEATTFRTHLEAKKKLQDQVMISFGKGAFKWGWRLTLFCTSFVGITTAIQTYRGKYGVLEYAVGGGLSGAMYKFNMGPRGWIVGSGVGAILGLICGGCSMGLLKLAGISMEEARYWQYYLKHSRDDYWRKGVAEYIQNEDFAVIKIHDDIIGEKGKDISNLDKNPSGSDTCKKESEKVSEKV